MTLPNTKAMSKPSTFYCPRTECLSRNRPTNSSRLTNDDSQLTTPIQPINNRGYVPSTSYSPAQWSQNAPALCQNILLGDNNQQLIGGGSYHSPQFGTTCWNGSNISKEPVGTRLSSNKVNCHQRRGSTNNCPPPTNQIYPSNATAVDLLVTNLDYNISSSEWETILTTQFQAVGRVLNVQLHRNTSTLSSNDSFALVRVASRQEAQLAIARLHRKKIGYKRIQLAILSSTNSTIKQKPIKWLDLVWKELIGVLQTSPGHALPAFQLTDVLSRRCGQLVTIDDFLTFSEIIEFKIRQTGGEYVVVDCVNHLDDKGGLLVLLKIESQNSSIFEPHGNSPMKIATAVCLRHCPLNSMDYYLALESLALPSVCVDLDSLRSNTHQLLVEHGNAIPLASFPACYKALFGCDSLSTKSVIGELKAMRQQNLHLDDTQPKPTCVPLEHLLNCLDDDIQPFRIRIDKSLGGGLGRIVLERVDCQEDNFCSPPAVDDCLEGERPAPASWKTALICRIVAAHSNKNWNLVNRLDQMARECVELVTGQPSCQLPLSRLIPFYHRAFGAPSRLPPDYAGYSRLNDLVVDALPSLIHVMGVGQRLLTLTHRVQCQRFTGDLVRVLQGQPNKSCKMSDFSTAYRRLFAKDFLPCNYGLCSLQDLVDQLDLTSCDMDVIRDSSSTLTSLTLRRRRRISIMESHLFACRVDCLLRNHSPKRYCLSLTEFSREYHKTFGCQPSNFVELLGSIDGQVVELVKKFDQIIVVRLVKSRMNVLLASHLVKLIEATGGKQLTLSALMLSSSSQCYGRNDTESLLHAIGQFPHLFRVEGEINPAGSSDDDKVICSLQDQSSVQRLAFKVLLVLTDAGRMQEQHFVTSYRAKFGNEPDFSLIYSSLGHLLVERRRNCPSFANSPYQNSSSTASGDYSICLQPLILLGRDLRQLLLTNQQQSRRPWLPMGQLQTAYSRMYGGRRLQPMAYNRANLVDLLKALDFVVELESIGGPLRTCITLCKDGGGDGFLGKLAHRVAYNVPYPPIRNGRNNTSNTVNGNDLDRAESIQCQQSSSSSVLNSTESTSTTDSLYPSPLVDDRPAESSSTIQYRHQSQYITSSITHQLPCVDHNDYITQNAWKSFTPQSFSSLAHNNNNDSQKAWSVNSTTSLTPYTTDFISPLVFPSFESSPGVVSTTTGRLDAGRFNNSQSSTFDYSNGEESASSFFPCVAANNNNNSNLWSGLNPVNDYFGNRYNNLNQQQQIDPTTSYLFTPSQFDSDRLLLCHDNTGFGQPYQSSERQSLSMSAPPLLDASFNQVQHHEQQQAPLSTRANVNTYDQHQYHPSMPVNAFISDSHFDYCQSLYSPPPPPLSYPTGVYQVPPTSADQCPDELLSQPTIDPAALDDSRRLYTNSCWMTRH